MRIRGIVQGVGFRPFIHSLAERLQIKGEAWNDTAGVTIEAEATEDVLSEFVRLIQEELPALAYIRSLEYSESEHQGYKEFTISKSRHTEERIAFYAPDVALCDDCLKELMDPKDRRYHYPFITCINCGPRLSIIRDIPYDRHNTEMADFPLCKACEEEYTDFHDRRYHAQPVACEDCGPHLILRDSKGEILSAETDEIVNKAVDLLRQGKILAIKGIGGYHLAVDARNDAAVVELRKRKNRPFKPFALMAGSIEMAQQLAVINEKEKELLLSRERPVVLLPISTSVVSENVAPGMNQLGIMLPYTPLHHLIFNADQDIVLVMTSGNLSEEPIAFDDDDAFNRLSSIADYHISYNRKILAQSDDSVVQVVKDRPFFVRRSRGYVPVPYNGRKTDQVILALGGDMKNSFSIARDDFVIMSQYLGDMADMRTEKAFRSTVRHFGRIFNLEPDVVVSDMHPGYMTTLFGDENYGDRHRMLVQHHHAHIAALLEEHDRDQKIIGIAYDGTGYGTDGTIWGSEILVADRKGFSRHGHFDSFALPGGESAIYDVWKIAVSLMLKAYGSSWHTYWRGPEADVVAQMIYAGINSPETCSIGRLFDGMAAILGVAHTVSGEAEAPMRLEQYATMADRGLPSLDIPVIRNNKSYVADTGDLVRRMVALHEKSNSLEESARVFHNAIIDVTVEMCRMISVDTGITTVGLAGGVFHNKLLLEGIWESLEEQGFEVLLPVNVPFNDGALSLGQIAVAREWLDAGMDGYAEAM